MTIVDMMFVARWLVPIDRFIEDFQPSLWNDYSMKWNNTSTRENHRVVHLLVRDDSIADAHVLL